MKQVAEIVVFVYIVTMYRHQWIYNDSSRAKTMKWLQNPAVCIGNSRVKSTVKYVEVVERGNIWQHLLNDFTKFNCQYLQILQSGQFNWKYYEAILLLLNHPLRSQLSLREVVNDLNFLPNLFSLNDDILAFITTFVGDEFEFYLVCKTFLLTPQSSERLQWKLMHECDKNIIHLWDTIKLSLGIREFTCRMLYHSLIVPANELKTILNGLRANKNELETIESPLEYASSWQNSSILSVICDFLEYVDFVRFARMNRFFLNTLFNVQFITPLKGIKTFSFTDTMIQNIKPNSKFWLLEFVPFIRLIIHNSKDIINNLPLLKTRNLRTLDTNILHLSNKGSWDSIKILMIRPYKKCVEMSKWVIFGCGINNLSHVIIDDVSAYEVPLIEQARVLILQNLNVRAEYLTAVTGFHKLQVIMFNNINVAVGNLTSSFIDEDMINISKMKTKTLILCEYVEWYAISTMIKYAPIFANSISQLFISMKYSQVTHTAVDVWKDIISFKKFIALESLVILLHTNDDEAKVEYDDPHDHPSDVLMNFGIGDWLKDKIKNAKLKRFIIGCKCIYKDTQEESAIIFDMFKFSNILPFGKHIFKLLRVCQSRLLLPCDKFNQLEDEMNRYWQTIVE